MCEPVQPEHCQFYITIFSKLKHSLNSDIIIKLEYNIYYYGKIKNQ